jgi:hypothetical protein
MLHQKLSPARKAKACGAERQYPLKSEKHLQTALHRLTPISLVPSEHRRIDNTGFALHNAFYGESFALRQEGLRSAESMAQVFGQVECKAS